MLWRGECDFVGSIIGFLGAAIAPTETIGAMLCARIASCSALAFSLMVLLWSDLPLAQQARAAVHRAFPSHSRNSLTELAIPRRMRLVNRSETFEYRVHQAVNCMHTSADWGRSVWTAASVVAATLTCVHATEPKPGSAAARHEFLEAARLTPSPERGARLFETCAACHGSTGRGTADGSVPAIAGQHGSVVLKQLVDFRHDQRWDERMQHFTDQHHLPTAQDLTDVAAYVSSLPRFPSSMDDIGDGSSLREGASVYFRACEACHGPLGQGDLLRLRPRLGGQHYAYLLRQLTETAAGGRPGMDPAHVMRLRALTEEQMRGVADYLSRVSPDLSSQRQR